MFFPRLSQHATRALEHEHEHEHEHSKVFVFVSVCVGVYACKGNVLTRADMLARQTTFNHKINILYFLETLCETAQRAGCLNYIAMTQRDLPRIIEEVSPPGTEGTANVAQTRHVSAAPLLQHSNHSTDT